MSKKIETAINHPGMQGLGAISGDTGVTFRIWAPNAKKVYLIGSFNDWNESATPLTHEEKGYWSAEVREAKAGDEYKFLFHTPQGTTLSH